MNKRVQFWMGFCLVLMLLLAGITYVFAMTPFEFAVELLVGVGVALFLSSLFIIGMAMMIDAKVSK